MDIPSTAHFVCGPIASGKTTLARSLCNERRAVRFAIDDWMHALFGADRPSPLTLDWALTRAARCEVMIESVAAQVLASGRDVVLELGMTTATKRRDVRSRVEATGHRVRFHFIDAERTVRLERLARRNAERGDTFSFEVTPKMFEAMDPRFEPPTTDELQTAERERHA